MTEDEWKSLAKNKAIVKQIPNFAADIFQKITGIDVRMEAFKDGSTTDRRKRTARTMQRENPGQME